MFELTPDEKEEIERWNLHRIPSILDRAVRLRIARGGSKKYICQQIVEDLIPLYEREIEELRNMI